MAFKKISTRKLPQNKTPVRNNVTKISISAMIIKTDQGSCYFERLRYFGCPNTINNGDGLVKRVFRESESLIEMQRDDEIRVLYDVFIKWPTNSTTHSRFYSLCYYIRALDAAGRTFNLLEDNVLWYGEELERLINLDKIQGGISSGYAQNLKISLSDILKAQGQYHLARRLPSIPTPDQIPHPTLDDDSFTMIGKFLYKGFKGYISVLQEGVPPTICPLFDQERLIEINNSDEEIRYKRQAAERRAMLRNGDWRNTLTRIAILLTFMFTGINTTPLFLLRRCDITFKKHTGDHYVLTSIKERAGGQKQINEIGFTRFSKMFIESWLVATEHWATDLDALVFPRFKKNGKISTWVKAESPQQSINKILLSHGFKKVTSSIFRKTRSQMLMRVLNDLYAVAEANNDSVETTIKDYLYGVQEQHDIANTGAAIALFKLSQGVDKNQVIAEFKVTCRDPLTALEALKDRQQMPNITRTGLCCWQPLAEKVAKDKVKYRNINPKLDTCIDFLDCFDCPSHSLIAEVDNIWMMMSFQDTLLQTIARPAYNSSPSEKFLIIAAKTEVILNKLREKAPKAYIEAEELNCMSPHPLYNDDYSIDDITEVYK